MREIEKYILGHKTAEDISIPTDIPFSLCEEGTCLYRGLAFDTVAELDTFLQSVSGDLQTDATVTFPTVTSWSDSTIVASDFAYGSGKNYYDGSNDKSHAINIIICTEIDSVKDVVLSYEDPLDELSDEAQKLMESDQEYILYPGAYHCGLYKAGKVAAKHMGITDEIFIYDDEDDIAT